MMIQSTFIKKRLLPILLIGALIVMPVHRFATAAEDVDELKFKKNQLQEKLDGLNKQIQSYQGQIDTTRKQQASLKNEIYIYETQIKSTQLAILARQTEMEETDLQIREIQIQVDRRVSEISDNKQVLRELIIELNEIGDNSFIQLALGTDDFSNFLDQLEYTNNLQDKVYQIVQNIKSVKQKLEEQQASLKVELSRLKDLTDQLQNTQAALTAQERDKQNLLDKTRASEKSYQSLLATTKNQEAALQEEIEGLDAKVRAQLGTKTITAKKGSLVMPMKGILTQGYGKTSFTALGYNFHNGLDIAAPAGTPIYAAADGVVNACDTGEASYGNWCSVKHNIETPAGPVCIISLYAHMRSFKVKTGQTVKQGDYIGAEGNTGNTTRLLYGPDRGYHIHFTVFDCEGFGISQGKYSKTYGPYTVPYGYTYDPRSFMK